jgi:UDP-N-acetylglucosamine 2-epimerase (non-hydrolysing)
MKQIAVFIGTRPELIKCNPLLMSSSIYIPVFVQQHTNILDTSHNGIHYIIQIKDHGSNRLNNIIQSILSSDLFDLPWDAILVQGDTAVACAAALAALNSQKRIIHLEAGLRTYNLDHPWPEEGYRRMIDSIASLALCPSVGAAKNLEQEHFTRRIEIVGNTSIDAISKYNLSSKIGSTVIVTLHRRENWSQIKEFFEAIEQLATRHSDLTFLLPIHPNPDIKRYSTLFQKVQVIDPVPHEKMCELLADCNCIISDSGGIQEEASFLGKKVFCCRQVTERTEIIDPYITFTSTPKSLLALFKPQESLLPSSTLYGTGKAYLKINELLSTYE